MTKHLTVDNLSEADLFEISNSLKEGKLVVFPTDTVYGIGTNAYDGDACARIYDVKGRPSYKPLIVLISNLAMLETMVEEISPIEQKLIDTFWPGPLTIKLKHKPGALPSIISAGDGYVRVRLVNTGIISKLIGLSGVPIVAPSANLSDGPTGTQIASIVNDLGDKVDYILDDGNITNDAASTVIAVEHGGISIFREGRITRADLEKIAPIND